MATIIHRDLSAAESHDYRPGGTDVAVADGGTGLSTLGTALQVLRTNAGATAIEWGSAVVDNASISQAKLNTATGEVSVAGTTWARQTLPGGGYGFYPQLKTANFVGSAAIAHNVSLDFSTYTSVIEMVNSNAEGTTYAQQRYISASGKDHWIFLLIDKATKQIIAGYQAPDHPCANQGGVTELDIPHPFGSYDSIKHEIVLVDNDVLNIAKTRINHKRSLLTVINEDFVIDDVQRPVYTPREIIKINEYPQEPIGKVIAKMKTPKWAKIMIQSEEITLEQRIIEKLPNYILYKTLEFKRG